MPLVSPSDQAGCAAQARTAVMTTSATSLGWEIIATCEAPSISVTVAPIRSAEVMDTGVNAPIGGWKHRQDRTAAPCWGWRGLGQRHTREGALGDRVERRVVGRDVGAE
jgi:hypothetical protein